MNLAYDRTGSGEPLVLLHGVGHRRQAWDAVVPLLAGQRDVITVDLPNHGESPALAPTEVGNYPAMVEGVEKFLLGLGLEKPHVGGNSLGGLIALDLGARGRATSVTALSPASFWNAPETVWIKTVFRLASLLGARLPAGAVHRIVRSGPARTALFGIFFGRPGRHDPAVLAADLRGLDNQRAAIGMVLKQIGSVTVPLPPPAAVPTTIGWGRRDLVLFPHQARRARRAIPAARIVPLRGCGHVPMADDPGQVAALLL
ncbi:MAG: alpha/beta fold hydrolase, partial [Acidimicrobiia bacterium]